MQLIYDPTKSDRNERERNLPFDRAYDFDWTNALYAEDDRTDYGERRFYALGHIGTRLHALVFTRVDEGLRIISLRKANAREIKRYEQEKAAD